VGLARKKARVGLDAAQVLLYILMKERTTSGAIISGHEKPLVIVPWTPVDQPLTSMSIHGSWRRTYSLKCSGVRCIMSPKLRFGKCSSTGLRWHV